MEFESLLEHYEENAGQKEKVALAIYALESRETDKEVTQAEVKDLIRSSRTVIKPSSVSTYFTRLDDAGWLSKTTDGYKLSIPGRAQVESLLDRDAFENPRSEDERFINTNIFEEDRFNQLTEDINKSYRYRIYDGTMVLTRKFFENMVFEILRDEYSGTDVQMFFDQENQRHYSFDELLNNLKIGVPDLKRFTKEGFDREFVEGIRDLKDKGNKGAHSIRVDFGDEEMEGYSEDATHYAEVLYEVWRGVTQANDSDE